MLQRVIDDLHTRFVGLVAENRHLPETEVRAIADGRILLAPEAVQLGLLDETGYWEDAMTRIADLLGVDRVIVYRYEAAFSLSALFRSRQSHTAAGVLHRLVEGRMDSPLRYRWAY
jgi:protease IV